ncbi:MAG: hypothetical protein Q4D56_03610 [Bacteroides sp.]|nr:hypothetical protein [Bacteroides sp.]
MFLKVPITDTFVTILPTASKWLGTLLIRSATQPISPTGQACQTTCPNGVADRCHRACGQNQFFSYRQAVF